MTTDPKILLRLKPGVVSFLFPLFQKGVWLKVETGCSIRSFLCGPLSFPEEYVANRIQTFFLNGKAVDDIDSALIRDGSILALSAALPGLLGATLRRGSYYAGMRKSISYTEERQVETSRQGMVELKLFNLLIPEMAPPLLKRGVWIGNKDLLDFFEKACSRFWSGCLELRLNGKKMVRGDLTRVPGAEKVFLRIEKA